MRPFEFVKPDTLAEASRRGAEPGALFKAAGLDVLDRLKERLEAPSRLVDLWAMRAQHSGIDPMQPGGARVGALTTLTELAESPALDEPRFGALRQAAEATGTRQVRNRATAGGNLLQLTRCWYRRSSQLGCAHGGDGPDCLAQTGENRYHAILKGIDCVRVHPSNLAPALVALDARVVVQKDDAERRLGILELYPEDPYADEPEHTLAPGEILTAIEIPTQPDGSRSTYRDSREKESFDWATTAAAVRVARDGSGTITEARICLGAVAPIPVFVPEAAAMLIGESPSDGLFAAVAAKAYEGAEPLEHNGYKVQLGQAVLRDTLAAAIGGDTR